jgi:tetratricopeptide (TPR) repeat protein
MRVAGFVAVTSRMPVVNSPTAPPKSALQPAEQSAKNNSLDGASRFAEAEPLYKRALAILEKALGPDHPDVATALNNLANLYPARGRYTDAEPLLRRALGIYEKACGPDHPNVATSLFSLASLYMWQGRYTDAEPLFRRALTIREKALGPDHPEIPACACRPREAGRDARPA